MEKNEIIPKGCQDRIGVCNKCKKNSILYLAVLTMNGKTDDLLLCNECYDKLIEIALNE